MEAVKDVKAENGIPKGIEMPRGISGVKDTEKVVDINKITDEDLSNLKQIFTWALTVTVRDRSTLASIVTFESTLFKKLESLKK